MAFKLINTHIIRSGIYDFGAETALVAYHILMRRAYKAQTYLGVKIEENEFFTSISRLADEVNLTSRKIRTVFNNLEKIGFCTFDTYAQGTLIRIDKKYLI